MNTDNLKANLPGLRFLPYIGENYGRSTFKSRILVLGESHYAKPDAPVDFTIQVVKDHIDGSKSLPFFSKIAYMTAGSNSKHEGECFWLEVAFYNFVQVPLDEARQRPSWEEWQTGLEPFQRVLEYLSPDKMIVCGKHMWNEILPPCLGEERVIDGDNVQGKFGEYSLLLR